MRRILLLSLGLLISHGSMADSSLWTDLEASQNGFAARGISESGRYNSSRHLTLDESGILSALQGAPAESSGSLSARPESPVTISLPLPDGSFAEVQAYDSPVMEAGLASELPDVKTWRIFGTDGKVLSGSESGEMLMWDGNFIQFEVKKPGGIACHDGQIEFIALEGRERITAGSDGYVKM